VNQGGKTGLRFIAIETEGNSGVGKDRRWVAYKKIISGGFIHSRRLVAGG